MNMVKVFIKGQEDKELSSFLRYSAVSSVTIQLASRMWA